ncbi:glycosyltransferase family 29 protein [Methylobacterium sp. CM6241]
MLRIRPTVPPSPQKLKRLAKEADELGQNELAIQYLKELYSINSDNEEVNIKYIRVLIKNKDTSTAEDIAEKYYQLGSPSAKIVQMYALLDYNTYTIPSCLDLVERKLKIFPDHCAIHARASVAYCWHGDIERAKRHARKAMALSDNETVAETIRRCLAKRIYNFGHEDTADWICRIGRVGRSVDHEILYDRLLIRTGNAADNPTTYRLFKKLLAIDNFAQRADLIEDYVDFTWRLDGPSIALVEMIDEHVARHPADIQDSLLLMRISLLVQLGLDDRALVTLDERPALKSKFRGCLSVAKLIQSHRLAVPPEAAADVEAYADLYGQLARSEAVLRERLSDECRSIAVVGNSSCEIGRNNGQRIDAHDDVVRFNRFDTDPPYDVDYGRKTTILVRHGADKTDFELRDDGASLVIISSGSILYRGRAWRAAKRLHDDGRTLCVFPQRFHTELSGLIKGSPSSGISFIYLLNQLRPKLRREDFFGFSFTDQIESSQCSAHYFEKAKPSFVHQWKNERDLFDSLFDNEAGR